MKKGSVGKSYLLHFLENEDEAQHTGIRFEILDEDLVRLRYTYHFPEYEEMTAPVEMGRALAIKMWKDMIKRGTYEFIPSATLDLEKV